MFEISTNTAEFKALMRKHGSRFPKVVSKLLIEVTLDTLLESRDNLAKMVYGVPIPVVGRRSRLTRRIRRRKAWKRTGKLLAGERMKIVGPFETVIYNSMKYAKPRHNLNRPSPVDGKVRRAPWRDKTKRNARKRIQRRFNRGVKAELENL